MGKDSRDNHKALLSGINTLLVANKTGIIKSRDIEFLKLTTPFCKKYFSFWRMHDFNYQLPKDLDKIIGKKNA